MHKSPHQLQTLKPYLSWSILVAWVSTPLPLPPPLPSIPVNFSRGATHPPLDLTDLRFLQYKPLTLIVYPLFSPTILYLLVLVSKPISVSASSDAFASFHSRDCARTLARLPLVFSFYTRVGSTGLIGGNVEIFARILWVLHAGHCGCRHNIHIVLVPLEERRITFEYDV